MKLLLFDIDGTLLKSGRQGRSVFASALAEVFGTAGDLEAYDFAGKMDPRIVLDLMTGAGVPEPVIHERLPRLKALYTARLEQALQRDRMELLPGVVEILESLAAREDVALGLLTGNWEAGARTKLSRFDLNRFFAFGAFGCDAIDRADLPPVAWERAERITGRRFRPEETRIIGDTVHDVSCSQAHGIPCLAVATGWTPAADLRGAGADWVMADLREAGSRLDWLG
jgi:phosphoglycolate phosphatase-like HAD superfamily hydrolase